MDKSTQNTQKLTKKDIFLKALRNNLGHISKSCISANIHRRTYYSWIEKDEKFKDDCDAVNEGMIDYVQSKLLDNIDNNDTTAIIFFLKTKGKSRGYDEKHQIELIRPIKEIDFEDI